MLLEVSSRPSDDTASFLCEASVHISVGAAVQHVALLWRLRARLAAAIAERSLDSTAPRKRSHDEDEALKDAAGLLSEQGVGRKLVMTSQRLEAALAAVTSAEGSSALALESSTLPGAGLFFAGKWLDADRTLSEYVGRNEKSKVKVGFGVAAVAADSGDASGAGTAAAAPAASGDAAPSSCASSDAAAASNPTDESGGGGAKPVADEKKKTDAGGVSLSAFFRDAGESKPRRRHDEQPDEPAIDDDDMPLLTSHQVRLLADFLTRALRVCAWVALPLCSLGVCRP